MNSSKHNPFSYPRCLAFCVLLTVPLVTWAGQQQKKSSSSSSAPAPAARPAAAPQHPASGQSGQRPAQPGNTTGGANRNTGTTNSGVKRSVTTSSVTPSAPGPAKRSPNVNGPYQPPKSYQAKSLNGGGTEYHNPTTNTTVTTNSHGNVTKIEAPSGIAGKTTISHAPGGGKQVVTGKPGSQVVSWGAKRGFVERPIAGRPGYISRTYVYGGRSYAVVYRQYYYGGYPYYRYVPAYYYGPGFYAWVGAPWIAPVPYVWGGIATPWFGFYSWYYTPYPAYASADYWLTDYLVSQNLQAAYQNQQAENNSAPPPAAAPDASPTGGAAQGTITPEVKAMIAEEVRQQLAAEKDAAAQPTASNATQSGPGGDQAPPALTQKIFVVSSNLDLAERGQACSLTAGDIIERRGKDAEADGTVKAEVVSSKRGDCAADSDATVQVQLADLQEMHNQMQQKIDAGLKTLADNQAKGLPNAPATKVTTVAAGTADPDANAAASLAKQDGDAARIETQVRQN